MKYYSLDPEVAGGFGENTVMDDPTARPPIVRNFHFQFEGWLGDDLLETVACFIATKRLVEAIRALQPSGIGFDKVEITKSEQFEELYPDRELPDFVWLKITGKPGRDDFGLSEEHRLVVSERMLSAMKMLNLNNCDFADYTS